jgi:hypothetical protein
MGVVEVEGRREVFQRTVLTYYLRSPSQFLSFSCAVPFSRPLNGPDSISSDGVSMNPVSRLHNIQHFSFIFYFIYF